MHVDEAPETRREIMNANAQDLGSNQVRQRPQPEQRVNVSLPPGERQARASVTMVTMESGRCQSRPAGADAPGLFRLRPER
jgi:hypothetical protein